MWTRSLARNTAPPKTRRMGCAKLSAVYCVIGLASGKPQSQAGARRSRFDAMRWTAQAATVRNGNKLSRRLDFIAQVELTPQGRIAGAFEAAAGLLRRKSAEAAFA